MAREKYQPRQQQQPPPPQPDASQAAYAAQARAAQAAQGTHGTHGTAVATMPQPDQPREPTQPELLRKILRDQQQRLAEVLPKRINIDRWINVVIAINHRDGKLRLCSPASIYTAAMQGAMLGLDFNPSLGQAYLIPRRNKRGGYDASFMIGYKGLRRLALNTGEFEWIESRIVYQSESLKTIGSFSYGYRSDRDGDDLAYEHTPNPDAETRGPITHAYAVARNTEGHRVIEVMTLQEIYKEARNRSESFLGGANSPWKTHEGMMCRKTVLKRLCGQAEMSADLADVIDQDNEDNRLADREQVNDRVGRGGDALARRLGVPADAPDEPGDLPFMSGDPDLDFGPDPDHDHDHDDPAGPPGTAQDVPAAAVGEIVTGSGADAPATAHDVTEEAAAGPA